MMQEKTLISQILAASYYDGKIIWTSIMCWMHFHLNC